MKKILLLSAALAVAATAAAQAPQKVQARFASRHASGVGVGAGRISHDGKVSVYSAPDGHAVKKVAVPQFGNVIRPQFSRAAARAEAPATADVLFESFESWDGTTATWVPDGWTVESKGDASLLYYQKWYPSAQPQFGPAPTDGDYMYGVVYAGVSQDEWLISPVFTPGENMNLYFDMNVDPFWFYDSSDGAINWDNMTFVGEPKIVSDLKVCVREEGGQWVTVRDFAEECKSMTVNEMLNYNPNQVLLPQNVDLSAFTGKKIQFAYQYVGVDGNSYYVDNIRVGLPQLDAPVYMMPLSTQYWGFDRDLNSVNFTSAILPAFDDIVFSSYDWVPDATYSWSYNDPADTDNWLTEEGDMLTVSYGTDYTNDFTTRSNLYYLPTLSVSAPGAASADYKNPADYMQIGGMPNFKFNDGTAIEMGMLPFQIHNDGLGVYTYRPDFGVSIPVFGYDDQTDNFWKSYSFPEEEDANNPDNAVRMTKIINMIYPSATYAIVATGVHIPAYTRSIGGNVEFTATIHPMVLDEEAGGFIPDFNTVVARASLLGKDIMILSEGDDSPDLSDLCFTFDAPVALQATDDVQAFVVAISGFNNPEVGYFCPFQQLQASDVPMAFGWLYKEITYDGSTRSSISPLMDLDADEPMMCAFAINIEGFIPWLHCEAESIEISNNGTVVGLDSYYAAEELTVTAPEWAIATLTGRYGETALTVNAEYSDTAREGELTVSAPGVTKTFKLIQPAGTGLGIEDEIADAASDTVTAIFDLAGQQLKADTLPAGVYLVKYASGKVRKAIVK